MLTRAKMDVNGRACWRWSRHWVVGAAMALAVLLGAVGAGQLYAAAGDVWTTWHAADYAGMAPVEGLHIVAWADRAQNKMHFYNISSHAERTLTVPGYTLSGQGNYSQPLRG